MVLCCLIINVICKCYYGYPQRYQQLSIGLSTVWYLACQYLLNCDEYRAYCKANNFYSHSKGFYSTTAEKCYSFVAENTDFIEAHTALNDAEIESFIFQKIVQKAKNKVDIGIIYFPHRIVGKVE